MPAKKVKKKSGLMSESGRQNIIDAQKKRWRKWRKEQKQNKAA